MPDDRARSAPSPWKEFLSELDRILTEPLAVHCIGGFVVCFFYGLPRPTGDIDYYTTIPPNRELDGVAGQGSALARKHKVHLHRVTVVTLPQDYEIRLTEMFPEQFSNLRLFAPDPYDHILSKLERNSTKDRDDADYLFKTLKLNTETLRERYERELRPNLANQERHDLTLKLWTGIFEAQPSKATRT